MAARSGDRGQGWRRAYVNARLFDPAQALDTAGGVIVADGRLIAVGPEVTAAKAGAGSDIVDCRGKLLMPGLVDMRVFTGEPGNEHRETLASASGAAAAGGVTTMIVMPNTSPVIDDAAIVDFVLRRARDTAAVRVAPMAALTKGLKGESMTEFGLLKEAGAVAVTDGNRAVANARLFRRALAYANDFGLLVVQHVEEPTLALGVMNEGEVSTRLGLHGIPAAAEVIILERDIRLVELTGARYHAAQVSCAASLDVVRRAKQRGLPVSCGVSVNHLVLNENDVGAYRTFFKLSPPLRSEDDRQALVAGLNDGTIDVVVSSHDPQAPIPSGCRSPKPSSAPPGLRRCFPPRSASTIRATYRSTGSSTPCRGPLPACLGWKPAGWCPAPRPTSRWPTSKPPGRWRTTCCARAPRTARLSTARWRGASLRPSLPAAPSTPTIGGRGEQIAGPPPLPLVGRVG
jgi:dihydroorotase